MSLNLSKLHKVKSDAKTTTFKHEDGHHITILHSALPALQREQIKRMPIKMAEGSIVPIPNNDQFPDVDQPSSMLTPQERTQAATPSEAKLPEEGQPADVPTPDTSTVPVDTTSNTANNFAPLNYKMGDNGMGQVITGLKEKRDVNSELADHQLEISKGHSEAIGNTMVEAKRLNDNFNTHHNQLIEDFQKGMINPNHYMENMKSGQKVSTAIGMLLGGLSNGLIHQGNPASDFIDQQINRDIQAQQQNQEGRKTLLQANQNLYHDNVVALNATRVDENNIYLEKMKQEALKLGTKEAQAAFDQQAGQVRIQNQSLIQQNAIRTAVLNELQNPKNSANGLSKLDPAQLVTAFGVSEPRQKEVFEEIKDAQNIKALAPKILDAFDKVSKNWHATDFVPGTHNADQKDFMGLINTTVKEQEGTARQAAFDSIERNMLPHFGDSKTTLATKRKLVEDYLTSHAAAPTAKGYGIPLDRFESTNIKAGMNIGPQIKYDAQGNAWIRGADGKPVPYKGR